jgi:hypothetical protein
MDTEKSSNELLKQYGILVGIIIGMFALLTVVIVLSENKWKNGLKDEIGRVLEEEEPGEWIVGEYIGLKTPEALSASCFQVRRKDNGAKGYALMLRIETIYGPFPAVFLYNDKAVARFVGIPGLHGRVLKMIGNGTNDAKVVFWIKRIPNIIKNAEQSEQNGQGAKK